MYGCTCIAHLLTQNKWFDMLAFTKKIIEYFQIASCLVNSGIIWYYEQSVSTSSKIFFTEFQKYAPQ